MFSYTVFVSRRLNCWNIIPIFFLFFLSSDFLRAFISSSSTRTCPDVGTSSAFIVLISVDFPAPEKPIIPYMSPSSILRLTSSNALTSLSLVLKILLTFLNSIIYPPPSALSGKLLPYLCIFSLNQVYCYLLSESIANL